MEFPDHIKRIDIGNYYGEACLIQRRLGWRASTDLHTALQLTLAYFRDNLAHYV
jgi:hypothetical protein